MDVDLHLEPNEASDLAELPPGPHLDELGWDRAYATVLDEASAERCLAVLGHRAGGGATEGWEARRVALTPSAAVGRTEDAEACAVRLGHLWFAGSHFGSKEGPLEPRRAWFARLALDDLWRALGEGAEPAPVALVRNPFTLHRAINDALAGRELLPLGGLAREVLVEATVARGAAKAKRWAGNVRDGDMPVNIEGMTFRRDGTMVLGLRHPVTAEGDALLVEVPDPDRLLDDPETVPGGLAVRALRGVGRPEEPVGVRALQLDITTGELHAVLGSLDALGKDSVLIGDRAQLGEAHCEHWRCPLPEGAGQDGADGELRPQLAVGFPGERSVEGLAQMGDRTWLYIVDRDQAVSMRVLVLGP
jgi:hypothetical protein